MAGSFRDAYRMREDDVFRERRPLATRGSEHVSAAVQRRGAGMSSRASEGVISIEREWVADGRRGHKLAACFRSLCAQRGKWGSSAARSGNAQTHAREKRVRVGKERRGGKREKSKKRKRKKKEHKRKYPLIS